MTKRLFQKYDELQAVTFNKNDRMSIMLTRIKSQRGIADRLDLPFLLQNETISPTFENKCR